MPSACGLMGNRRESPLHGQMQWNRHHGRSEDLKSRQSTRHVLYVPSLCTAIVLMVLAGRVLLSPTPSNAQSNDRLEVAVGSGNSNTTQQESADRADDFFTWLARFSKAGRDLAYLVEPATRSTVPLGVSTALAMAVYYDNNRPHSTRCVPLELDKWRHCYVGCKISSWCPGGSLSASLLSVLKEIRDVMRGGEFSRADVLATLEGAWDCPVWESCEEFCCRQFGK